MIASVYFNVQILLLLSVLSNARPTMSDAELIQLEKYNPPPQKTKENSDSANVQLNSSQDKQYCMPRETPKYNSETQFDEYSWIENWHGHTEKTFRSWGTPNAYVDVYFDFIQNEEYKWIFEFISRVWEYMKSTYGNFGSPCLYVIIHRGSLPGGRLVYSQNSSDSIPLNILDLGSKIFNSWILNSTRAKETDLITNYLSYFVEFSSKDVLGSPSHSVWKGSLYDHSAWAHIFTYDVYVNLNLTDHANRYKTEQLGIAEDHPRPSTFWFKDWFLPIYEHYGGNKVLNNYFHILKKHFPHKDGRYSKVLDVGGFVHFWSAAAGVDFAPLAWKAFGWNETYENELEEAKKTFYQLNSHYNFTDKQYTPNSITPASTFTSTAEQIILTKQSLSDSSNRTYTIVGVSAGAGSLIVIILVLLSYVFLYRKIVRNLKTEIHNLTAKEVEEFFEGNLNDKRPSEGEQELVLAMPFIKDFEIPKDQIILAHDKVIGSGQFGVVIHGFVRFVENNELIPVAVKLTKPNVDVLYFKAFLSEVKIMTYLGKHENIVELLGTCTVNIKNCEILMALELCPLGNLNDYLNNNRQMFLCNTELCHCHAENLGNEMAGMKTTISGLDGSTDLNKISTLDLVKWSLDICNAMVYVKQKKVIHGDLAARNVLLTSNRTAKICDFGLSRQFLNYENYLKTSKTPVPWRWLAIECMKQRKFSTESDVWAYGVLLWEIFSLGETPYGCYTYDLHFVEKLISGERLLKPLHASEQIYQLMQHCWKMDPKERISFQDIHATLSEIMLNPVSSPVI